jgi:hypothetical protein
MDRYSWLTAMRREELIEAIRAAPFRPFRLFLSDGRAFEIRHPEVLMVARHSATVGIQDSGGAEPASQSYPQIDRFALVDLLHITGIEQLPQPQPRGG